MGHASQEEFSKNSDDLWILWQRSIKRLQMPNFEGSGAVRNYSNIGIIDELDFIRSRTVIFGVLEALICKIPHVAFTGGVFHKFFLLF